MQSFEYKQLNVPAEKLSFYLDCYEKMGWEEDERTSGNGGMIMLRRDRKILNKAELTRLERQFEACMRDISQLETGKGSLATIYALVVGMIGCAFMAGAVFSVTADPPLYVLMVILAIPAFLCWGLAPIIFKKQLIKKTTENDKLIEDKYDEIDGICEKAGELL